MKLVGTTPMVNFQLAADMVHKRVQMAMISTVQISRGDISGLDQTTLQVGGITNSTVFYQGPAHIHNVVPAGTLSVGQAPFPVRSVQISIPIASPTPDRDDILQVIEDSDPDVQGRTFRITDVDVGGLISDCHTLTCQGYFEFRYG